MKSAAFQATFSDFKLIKGRKVAQIVLEVDISAADAALETLGGVPRPDKEAWVAVARILPAKAISEPSTAANDAPKERRPWDEWPMPQQVGYRCTQDAFMGFLSDEFGNDAPKHSEEAVARWVRGYCQVGSRAEILPGTVEGNRWLLLEAAYQTWLAEAAHV